MMSVTYTLRSAHIFVSSLAVAREFYVDRLGMRAKVETGQFLILDTGTCELMIWESRPDAVIQGSDGPGRDTCLHLGVEDVRSLYRVLLSRGVEFTSEPKTEYWGGTMVSFFDPDRNYMSLVQYPQ